MDIRSLFAAREYAASRPVTEPEPGTASGQSARGPADFLAETGKDFAATLEEGERAARDAMTGDADPHALVMALAQSELAVETAVAVRDKVVEAYQEILRMPV